MTEVATHAYIGVCKCGGVIAAFAITPKRRKDIAKEIAEWVEDGLTIEHVSMDEARTRFSQRACELGRKSEC